MGRLKPLLYSRFIQVICLMGAYIGPEKKETGEFMIYQSCGTGYIPMPRGPQCAFKGRAGNEFVTVDEIEYVLDNLRYSAKVFIETEAACQIPTEPEAAAIKQLRPPAKGC
jgi:hypothetical protein